MHLQWSLYLSSHRPLITARTSCVSLCRPVQSSQQILHGSQGANPLSPAPAWPVARTLSRTLLWVLQLCQAKQELYRLSLPTALALLKVAPCIEGDLFHKLPN